jgi:hypothetical protein
MCRYIRPVPGRGWARSDATQWAFAVAGQELLLGRKYRTAKPVQKVVFVGQPGCGLSSSGLRGLAVLRAATGEAAGFPRPVLAA